MAWQQTGSLKGPKGDKGDTGDQGVKGDPGPPGAGSEADTGDLLLTLRNPGAGWLRSGNVYAQSQYPELFELTGLVPDGPPGHSFRALPNGTGRALAGYCNINDEEIVGVGNMEAWYSNDRGATGVFIPNGFNFNKVFSLPSGLYAIGSNVLARSVNRGQTFTSIQLPPQFGTTPVLVQESSGRLFLGNGNRHWYSDDYGMTWTAMGSSSQSNTIFLLGNDVVIQAGYNNTYIRRSVDNGTTFAPSFSQGAGNTGLSAEVGVSFGNGVGMFGGRTHYYRTSDYGVTWTSTAAAGLPSISRYYFLTIQSRVFMFYADSGQNYVEYSDNQGLSFRGRTAISYFPGIHYLSGDGLVMPNAAGTSGLLAPFRYDYDETTMFKTPNIDRSVGYVRP